MRHFLKKNSKRAVMLSMSISRQADLCMTTFLYSLSYYLSSLRTMFLFLYIYSFLILVCAKRAVRTRLRRLSRCATTIFGGHSEFQRTSLTAPHSIPSENSLQRRKPLPLLLPNPQRCFNVNMRTLFLFIYY